jgi:hypothetical protein
MIDRLTYAPGHPAPASGIYEQINIFDSATNIRVHVPRGQPLPAAPIGHSWAAVKDESDDC